LTVLAVRVCSEWLCPQVGINQCCK